MIQFELSYSELVKIRDSVQEDINNSLRLTAAGVSSSGILEIIGAIVFPIGIAKTVYNHLKDARKDQKVASVDLYNRSISSMNGGEYNRVRFIGNFTNIDGVYVINGYPQAIGYRHRNGNWELLN